VITHEDAADSHQIRTITWTERCDSVLYISSEFDSTPIQPDFVSLFINRQPYRP